MKKLLIILLLTCLSFISLGFEETAFLQNIYNLRTPEGLIFFQIFSNVGLILLILLLYLRYKSSNSKKEFIRLSSIVLALEVSFLINIGLDFERPYEVGFITEFLPAQFNSFPSLHTTLATAIGYDMLIAWPIILLVAFGRLYLGVHFIKDILFGLLIGVLVPFLVNKSEKYFKNLEFNRQLLHLIIGLSIACLLINKTINGHHLILAAIAGTIVSLLIKQEKLPYFRKLLKKVERKKDLESFPGKGAIYMFFSCGFVSLIFEPNIAIVSILILSIGDSLTHLGLAFKLWPNPFNKYKYLEGTIIGIIFSFFASILFLPWYVAIVGCASLVAESIELKIFKHKIDDNILVPLLSAILMSLTIQFIPIQ